jgi:hypothetical protein
MIGATVRLGVLLGALLFVASLFSGPCSTPRPATNQSETVTHVDPARVGDVQTAMDNTLEIPQARR